MTKVIRHFYLKERNNIYKITKKNYIYILGEKRPGSIGETTRLNFRGETTRGETTRGKLFGGETSCYPPDRRRFSVFDAKKMGKSAYSLKPMHQENDH